ncbi:MAG: hypothetical protein QNJ49_12455 [Mastigocoleus sp. MO_167.B18]|nr:hypothetical protein [Mastigocoleus sp. MO_167.B18]
MRIAGMMVLPPPLEVSFREEIRLIQEESKLITLVLSLMEWRWLGERDDVIEVLETRFGNIPA